MSTEIHNVTLAGAITYWNLNGDFNHDILHDRLDALGLKDLCPEPRSHAAALKQGLMNAIAELDLENLLVRGLANVDEDGFVVIREERGSSDNEYDTLYHAVYDPSSDRVAIEPDGNPFADAVRKEHDRCYASIAAHQVSRAMVLIADAIGGTPLRPAGGVYWLPEDQLARWQQIIEAVTSSGDGRSRVYQIRTVFDDAAVNALRDAVANSIAGEAKRIAEYAEKPNVKERFLKARKSEATALHEKVNRWEEILKTTLADLHGVANDCEKHVVEASLDLFPNLFGDEFGGGDLVTEESLSEAVA